MNKKYSESRPNISADLRREVNTEAGHTCTVKLCMEHTYLEIHHIDENRENNILDNLILLCDKHHKMAHAKKISRKELKNYKAMLNGGNSSDDKMTEFYRDFVNFISKNMFLVHWINISDNLIATSIEGEILDGFNEVETKVFRSTLPGAFPELDNAILELGTHINYLRLHFTKSKHSHLFENKWWRRDMRWKKVMLEQDEYQKRYDEVEVWQKELYKKHCNLVVALNYFAKAVRETIDPVYFNCENFVVCDSMGTTNGLEGYEYIPEVYAE